MTAKHRNLRAKMLFTTAAAALLALPSATIAAPPGGLVDNGDLVTAEDSTGNPGRITITNPDASTANISVLAPVVIANWTQFNVPATTTLNVTNGSGASVASLLNRVTGGNPSDIGGTINATDVNFWLLNQNGILFGSNTSVNAASFFASTLAITDADFFDFYNGTNNAGNGSQTLNFSSPAASFMIAPAGASFVTDGSLFFAGPGLSLNASFDARSGTVSFVAANNFEVTFSPGSPLSYEIMAGTTVADPMVDGTVAGKSADFVFQTAAGVMSAMLTVNADVATTAAATERGIYLYAGGASPASVTVGGALSSTGGVEADVTGNLTISQDLSGSYATLRAAGDVSSQDVTATSGAIEVDSTGAGALSLGNLSAGTAIALDTSGTIGFGSATAGGAFTIGAAVDPSSVTATGNISAGSVDFDVTGALNALAITATAGGIDIDAGSVSAGALAATDDVFVDAAGAVSLASARADSDVSGAGALAIGASTLPTSLTITGASQGVSVDLQADGDLQLGKVTSTNGIVDLDSTGGTIGASTISATGGSASLTAPGAITTTGISSSGAIVVDSVAGPLTLGNLNAGSSITLDTDGAVSANRVTASGALVVGSPMQKVASATFTDTIRAASVDLQVSGSLNARAIIATTGDVNLMAGTIAATTINSFNGNATLMAVGDVTTTSINALNGAIDVDSTMGGALDLGSLGAGSTIALDTSGAVTTTDINPSGALTVGNAMQKVASATFGGLVRAASVDVQTLGLLDAQDITATTGNVNLMAGTIEAGKVNSFTGNATLEAVGNVTTTSISALNGAIDVDSTMGGALDLGNLGAGSTIALDTLGAVTTADINPSGALTVGSAMQKVASATFNGLVRAASVDVQTLGLLDAQDITATTGDVNLMADTIEAARISANAGNVLATADNDITTTSITAAAGLLDIASTMGGALSLGSLGAGTTIDIDTSGSVEIGSVKAGGLFRIGGTEDPANVTFTGHVVAGSIDFDVAAALNALNVTATLGDVDIDAGSVSAGAVRAADDVFIDAPGTIALASVRADSDNSGAGNLAIGVDARPTTLTVTGTSQGVSVILQAQDALQLGKVVSTAGAINLDSNGTIVAADVSATGGNATLTAAGAIKTTSIASNMAIDVDSTAGGDLDLGNLDAGGAIALDTDGALVAGRIDAGTALNVGTAATPSAVEFTGNATADTMMILSDGAITTRNLTSNNSLTVETTDGDLTTGVVTVLNPGTTLTLTANGAASDVSSAGLRTNGSDIVVTAGQDISTGNIATSLAGTPTAGNVTLDAGRNVTTGFASVGEDMTISAPGAVTVGGSSIGGALAIGTPMDKVGSVRFTSAISAGSVDVQAGGAILGQTIAGSPTGIASTAGGVNLMAASIDVGNVSATGGNATLMATGAIKTTSIASNMTIDVDSTAGGDLDLGNLDAGGAIALDTDGALVAGRIDAGTALNVGTAATPSAVEFTGNATADTMMILSDGAITTRNLTSNNSLTVETTDGDLTTGVVTVLNPGTTLTLTANGAASDVSSAGLRTNGSDIVVTAGQDISTGNIATSLAGTPTAGNVTLDAGRNVTTGFASVGEDMTISAPGAVTVGGSSIGGALAIGTPMDKVGSVRFTSAISAGSVDVQAGGAILGQTIAGSPTGITSTAGGVNLMAASIDVGNVSATGGNATLMATDAIKTMSIASNMTIDVDSTAGGDLDLGNLDAGGAIALDTTGAVATGSIDAVGDLTIGTFATPSSVAIGGDASAASLTVRSVGQVNAKDLTATGGAVSVQTTAGGIKADDVLSSTAGAFLIAGGATSDIAVGDVTTVNDTLLSAGRNITAGDIDVAAALAPVQATLGLQSGGSIKVGAVTVNEDILVDAGTTLDAASLTAGDDINVRAAGLVTLGSATTTGLGNDNFVASFATGPGTNSLAFASPESAAFAGSDIQIVSTGGNIQAGTFDAADDLRLEATAMNVTVTGLSSAGGDMTVDAAGAVRLAGTDVVGAVGIGQGIAPTSVTLNADASAGSFDIDTTGEFSALVVTATAGDIDIDAGSVKNGTLSATDDVFVDAAGAIALASVRANSDSMGAGSVAIGADTLPSTLTITGASQGVSVDLQASGTVKLGTVSSTAGVVDIDSTTGSIATTGVTAAGGDALLTAAQNVTATGAVTASGKADIDATAGFIAVTSVTAGANAELTAGKTIDASGAISGRAVDIDAVGNIRLATVTSIAGVVDIDSTAGSITTTGVTATGGDALLTAAQSVTATGAVTTTGKADIDAVAGAIAVTSVTAGANAELTAGKTIDASGAISGRAVDIDAVGNIRLATVTSTAGVVDIDSTAGSITTTGVSATGGDALLTAARNVTATGEVTATGKADIDATAGAIAVTSVAANGNAELTAGMSIDATDAISGRLVDIDAGGNITLAGVSSTAGVIDIDSTSGSIATTGIKSVGGDALLTAERDVTATGAISATGKVDIDAARGSIEATAITASGGNAELTARSGIATSGTVRASGAIDVDSTGGGALTLGGALTSAATPALAAGGAITLDTTGAVTAGATTAGGALSVGATAIPSSVTFTGPVDARGMTVRTQGTFTSQAAVQAGSSATVTARDVAIGAGFTADNVTLRAATTGTVRLGTGSATFALSDAELDRVTAATLTIDAGANAVTVTDVSLTGAAGADKVTVATTGTITFTGDLTADGANRMIRFGGSAAADEASATGLAGRISGDIKDVTINVGQATLDLRAVDIAFGRSSFLAEVEGRDSQDIAIRFVGNAASSLYNSTLLSPLDGDRATNPVYLQAGNLSVAYANSALFQNTGLAGAGTTTTNGVVIGSPSGGGKLTLDTLDPTNTFALFGQLNDLVGPSAAVAGPTVILVDGTVQPPFSRVNGCLIGSGAGCLNTVTNAVQLSLPRQNVNILSAETGLLVPFDPLVGTNNEGLFSDAAADEENIECPRDENGVCVERQGGN